MAGSPSQLPRSGPPTSDGEEDSARMTVNVQILLTQKNLLVEAMNQDTVQDVKLKIQAKEGISPDEFVLMFGGKMLAVDRNLASLDLPQEPTFDLVVRSKDDVSVIVDMSGRKLTLGVKFWYTVGYVKALAIAKMCAQLFSWHMVYRGKQLEDHKTLVSYDIVDGSFLQLVYRTVKVKEVKNKLSCAGQIA